MDPRPSESPTGPMRFVAPLFASAAVLGLAACAGPDTRETEVAQSPAQTQVYFYPARGQNQARQDRDRYECYLWARKQTGFDPSDPDLAPHQRFNVVGGPPPGQGAAVGAVTGAAVGAIASSPGHKGEGAVVGAVAGAMIGAASETAQRREAERRISAQRRAQLEQQAANYRRALTACLEGRGYTVR